MAIPSMDFRGNKFVNDDGTLSEVAQSFFDLLNTFLIKNFGAEGLVMSSQPTANVGVIQNNVTTGPTGLQTSTCQFGTMLYNQTTNKAMVALNDGAGNPIFKEITTI